MKKKYKLIVNFEVKSMDPSYTYEGLHHMTIWVPAQFVNRMISAYEDSYARLALIQLVSGWMAVNLFSTGYCFCLLGHTVWNHKGELIWEGEV